MFLEADSEDKISKAWRTTVKTKVKSLGSKAQSAYKNVMGFFRKLGEKAEQAWSKREGGVPKVTTDRTNLILNSGY